MKPTSILLALGLCLATVRGEALSDTEREALLSKLEEMRANADTKVDARYRAAIAAYQAAMSSNEAAIELYLNCVEKVNFTDQMRKEADFREWKRNQDEKLSDPGLPLALRLQLRWLILSLRAASENADRNELIPSVIEVVDTIVNEAEKLKNQQEILKQSAVASLFAQAYDISNVKADGWVFSPGQVDQIYDKILLPPLRAARQPDAIRAAWLRRISQLVQIQKFASEKKEDDPNGKRRIGMVSDMRAPEYERYIVEEVPGLQWQMEVDLFSHGDQRDAAVRMLAHLDKHISHKSARDWALELTNLLKGDAAALPDGAGTQPGS